MNNNPYEPNVMSVEQVVDAFDEDALNDEVEAKGCAATKVPADVDFESLPVFVESDVEGYDGVFIGAKGVRLAQIRGVFRRPKDDSFVYEEIMPADDGPWYDKERVLAVVIETHNDFTNAHDGEEK